MAADMMLKIAMVMLAVSVFLQLLACLTPAWFVLSSNSGRGAGTNMYGLFYSVSCPEAGDCETTLHWEDEFEGRIAYGVVSSLFRVSVALVLCTIACILKVKALQKSVWFDSYKTICVFCLLVSNPLQWVLVSDFANMTAVTDLNTGVAWSVFLYAIGACLITAVTVINLVALRMGRNQSHRRNYELAEVAK